MGTATAELRAAAQVLAGRALLKRSCALLAPHGVTPLVLKGILISALTEGTGAFPRRMSDVDVLVESRQHSSAERVLVAGGLVVVGRTQCATTLRDRELGLDLDLHTRLVEPGLFRIDEAAVLRRSRIDDELLGARVRIPDRHDLYAHLVAHFVRNRSNARDQRRLRDFSLVAQVLPMNEVELALHLESLGLGRAARYALGLAIQAGDRFAAEVVACLPPDLWGDRVADIARSILARHAGNDPVAILPLHLLNWSALAGTESLARHLRRAFLGRASMSHRCTSHRTV